MARYRLLAGERYRIEGDGAGLSPTDKVKKAKNFAKTAMAKLLERGPVLGPKPEGGQQAYLAPANVGAEQAVVALEAELAAKVAARRLRDAEERRLETEVARLQAALKAAVSEHKTSAVDKTDEDNVSG